MEVEIDKDSNVYKDTIDFSGLEFIGKKEA